MKRRMISLIVLIAMICAMLPQFILSANATEIIDFGTCGENLAWNLTSNGVLTISGEGDMTDNPWNTLEYMDFIQEVIIEQGVTSIAFQAFSTIFSLRSVTIPNTVTTIDYSAFSSCTSLGSITIPKSVTYMELSAFDGCDSLTGIWVDESNPVYSSDEHGVLYNKEQTCLLKCPHGLTGDYSIPNGVQKIEEESFVSSKLDYISIPESMEEIPCEDVNAFSFCSAQIFVHENNQHFANDQYGVLYNKNMTSLIHAPRSLEGQYKIPDGVTYLCHYAFATSELSGVIMADTVTATGKGVFLGCKNLIDIKLSQKLEMTHLSAFSACTSLQNITIPESVSIIGQSFENCTNLQSIYIEGNVNEIDSMTFFRCPVKEIYFMGDAPQFDSDCFSGLSIKIYYPSNNHTWTNNIFMNYGGNITWIAADFPNKSGFWLNKDGWSFANSSFSFKEDTENPLSGYYIPEERYNEVFGSAYLDANKFTKSWGGNCAGMSTTAILFFLDLLNWQTIDDSYPNDFSTPNSFYQTVNYHYATQSGYAAIGNATEVTRLIEAYQLYINEVDRSEYERRLDNTYRASEFTKDGVFSYYTQEHLSSGTYVSSMLEVFNRAYDNNTPLYISLKGNDFSHAIVFRTDKKPKDMENGWWRVYVYDPNKPYLNDAIAEKVWEERPDAGLKDACNNLSEDVYIELNPSQNLWRYCTSVNSDSSSKYLGCSLSGDIQYIKCDATDGEGNNLTVKIPEYFYTIDLNDVEISDYAHPTTTSWLPNNTADSCIITVDGTSNCLIYSSTGVLIAIVEDGEAIVLNGNGYYAGHIGEAEEAVPAGGKLYLPNDTYTIQYTSGQMAFLGNNNVISFSSDCAVDLTVDVTSNSIQAVADTNGTLSVKCANVISSEKCSYVETEGTLVAGEVFSIAYSDDNKVEASTDSKEGSFDLYEKNANQEEPTLTETVKHNSFWWLWIVGGVAVIGLIVLLILLKRKK